MRRNLWRGKKKTELSEKNVMWMTQHTTTTTTTTTTPSAVYVVCTLLRRSA